MYFNHKIYKYFNYNLYFQIMESIWNNYKKIQLIKTKIFYSIYKAKNIKTGKIVAIKEINKKKYKTIINKSFKVFEINNIQKDNKFSLIIDTIDTNNYFYIIMNYYLFDLDVFLKYRSNPISIDEIKEILNQLNLNLQSIEDKKNLILNFSNIIFCLNDDNQITIKIKQINENKNKSLLSPEILEGKEISDKSSIWNLGIIIYYILFKQYPFYSSKKDYNFDLNELKKIEDENLIDLLKKMLEVNENNRISWNDYFIHPFFTNSQQINVECEIHSTLFNYYCINCKCNLCDLCLNNHLIDNHEIISFSQIGLEEKEKEQYNNLINEIENNMKIFQNIKNRIKNIFKKLVLQNSNYSSIYNNEPKNNFKQYYLNLLNIMNENIKLKKKKFNINDFDFDNSIKCFYNIKEEDLNKPIQIFNFMDDIKRKEYQEIDKKNGIKDIIKYELNDNELKDKVEIYINYQRVDFSPKYIFNTKENSIKILCKKPLQNLSCLFYECNYLVYLDFSSFDAQNVYNLRSMINKCDSLRLVNLSNFNSPKITNMRCSFRECPSLATLNLSQLITNNVIDMGSLFQNSSSLHTLDLSNFNTSNVKNMSHFLMDVVL